MSIFLIGATGYIGGAVLNDLLKSNPDLTVTCIVRSEEKVKKLTGYKKNVKAIQGSFEDADLLEEQAEKHEIVINAADADHVGLTNAILKGMAKRNKSTGHRGILIHTSGTGLLTDNARGLHETQTIYSDLGANPDTKPPLLSIDSLSDTAHHRNVDLTILAADQRAEIRSFIIIPSTIYGLVESELVDQGISNNHSQQVPGLITASVDRKRAGMVGKGLNIWPNVHIQDVVDLFALVHKYATSGGKGFHGHQGYFFGENGEHTLFAVGQNIGRVLKKKGLTDDVEPTTFNQDEIKKYFNGSEYLGSNSRARADNSRKLGWKPKYDADDFFGSFEAELEDCLKRAGPDGKFKFSGNDY